MAGFFDFGLSNEPQSSRVPSNRLERMFQMGVTAGGMAASAMIGGARAVLSGETPALPELLFSSSNAEALAQRLSKMRGAAMKMGQLLSLEGGAFLPPALSEALSILGSQANRMTEGQLRRVLDREYGRDWRSQFEWFGESPIAAASIGQVHRARTRDGRNVAVKVQFPGVAEGIDGDVDNLASLVRMSGIVPSHFDLDPLIEEVRRQLLAETDYVQEGESLRRYRELVDDDDRVVLPAWHPDLTTPRVLAMDYVASTPIHEVWDDGGQQTVRDHVGSIAQELVMREIFEFRFMQSDPNFANFRYQPATGQLVLLDFGSMVEISEQLSDRYRSLIGAAVAERTGEIEDLLLDFGWVGPEDEPSQRRGLAEFIVTVGEPLRAGGAYDYGSSDLAARVQALGMELTFGEGLRRPPPPELVFVHRKLAGTYLLCAQLGARVPTAALTERALASHPTQTPEPGESAPPSDRVRTPESERSNRAARPETGPAAAPLA